MLGDAMNNKQKEDLKDIIGGIALLVLGYAMIWFAMAC
jgi:hypothetical protein